MNIASVQSLHKDFGNTLSSTLWRFVETVGVDRPVVGLITCHPHRSRRPAGFDPTTACRHFIQSHACAGRFSSVPKHDAFRTISSYCGAQSGGPLGSKDLVLTDDNGDEHLFAFETFFIRYPAPALGEALTIGVYMNPHFRVVAA